jgi:hypothetical protein
MKFGKNLSLRVQLTLAMAGCVLLAVTFGYWGLSLFSENLSKQVEAQLPPKALAAVALAAFCCC